MTTSNKLFLALIVVVFGALLVLAAAMMEGSRSGASAYPELFGILGRVPATEASRWSI
jgi:hypothetical protein